MSSGSLTNKIFESDAPIDVIEAQSKHSSSLARVLGCLFSAAYLTVDRMRMTGIRLTDFGTSKLEPRNRPVDLLTWRTTEVPILELQTQGSSLQLKILS